MAAKPHGYDVIEAANALEVSEYTIFEWAYHAFYGRTEREAIERAFGLYIAHNKVPHWLRHYLREMQ